MKILWALWFLIGIGLLALMYSHTNPWLIMAMLFVWVADFAYLVYPQPK